MPPRYTAHLVQVSAPDPGFDYGRPTLAVFPIETPNGKPMDVVTISGRGGLVTVASADLGLAVSVARAYYRRGERFQRAAIQLVRRTCGIVRPEP